MIDLTLAATIIVIATAIGVAGSQFFYGRPVVANLKDQVDALRDEVKNEKAHGSERVERIRALEARPDMTVIAGAIDRVSLLIVQRFDDVTQGLTLHDVHLAVVEHTRQAAERDVEILKALRAMNAEIDKSRAP